MSIESIILVLYITFVFIIIQINQRDLAETIIRVLIREIGELRREIDTLREKIAEKQKQRGQL
jgi:hypothetical protein